MFQCAVSLLCLFGWTGFFVMNHVVCLTRLSCCLVWFENRLRRLLDSCSFCLSGLCCITLVLLSLDYHGEVSLKGAVFLGN